MTIPAAIRFDPRSPQLRDVLEALPVASPGIYLLRAESGDPHLAWSRNLRRRMARLFLSGKESASMGRVREAVVAVDYWLTTSRLESALLMHTLARHYHPDDYLFRLKLRIPWFVGLSVQDPFPRLNVSNRVPRKETMLLGPFPSKTAAQIYEQHVAGLFQLRRCTETLAPSPDHPGCVYGEMNQCMRPCQCVVTHDEYASEAQRMSEFLSSNGRAALAVMTSARDRAAEQTDFEQAAHIHKQVEKIKAAAAARDGVVTNVYHLNGLALTRGAHSREFRLWPMLRGHWQDGLRLEIPRDDTQAKSLDQTLRELLINGLCAPSEQGRRAEELAIFARWYFSSWRDGAWFPFRSIQDLNYRKLVKEISNMAKSSAS